MTPQDFFKPKPLHEKIAGRERTHEDRVVRRVLRRFSPRASLIDAQRQQKVDTGDQHLTVEWYEREFGALPMLLRARVLIRPQQDSYITFLKGFVKSHQWRLLSETLDERGPHDSRPVAVVWPHPRMLMQVLHTDAFREGVTAVGVMCYRSTPPKVRCVLEPFDQYLSNMPNF